MLIANPNQVELTAWLSVDDALNLEQGAKIKVFLNTDPLNPILAKMKWMSYEAQIHDIDQYAYLVKGELTDSESLPRIGLKGTAKIYGEKVTLFYYLFRRPLTAIRQFFGW